MVGVFSFGLIFVLHHREKLGELHTTVTYPVTVKNQNAESATAHLFSCCCCCFGSIFANFVILVIIVYSKIFSLFRRWGFCSFYKIYLYLQIFSTLKHTEFFIVVFEPCFRKLAVFHVLVLSLAVATLLLLLAGLLLLLSFYSASLLLAFT